MSALIALGLWFSEIASAAAQDTCVIQGATHYLRVSVQPARAEAFELVVRAGEAFARPPVSSACPALIQVRAPLRFEGTTRKWSTYFARPVDGAGGLVHLSPLTAVSHVTARADHAIVSVHIAPWSTAGATIHGLSVPCSSLTLTPPQFSRPASEHTSAQAAPRSSRVVLRARPNGGASILLAVDDRQALRVTRDETSGNFVLITHHWSDGSFFTGWVESAALRDEPYATEGLLPWPDLVEGCSTSTDELPRTRVIVAAGTPVYARPGTGLWAVVVDAGVPFEARRESGVKWVQLVRMPGITDAPSCDELTHAWVPKSAVTYLD